MPDCASDVVVAFHAPARQARPDLPGVVLVDGPLPDGLRLWATDRVIVHWTISFSVRVWAGDRSPGLDPGSAGCRVRPRIGSGAALGRWGCGDHPTTCVPLLYAFQSVMSG